MTIKIRYFLLVMTVAILACSVQVAQPVMTATPEPTATKRIVMTRTVTPKAWTAKVELPVVNVRTSPNGESTDEYLTAGQQVTIISCSGDWCLIQKPRGYVFRGCLSDNPKNLGCTAK